MEKIEKIQKAYKDYVLENGTQPPSVYIFTKKLKFPEAEFYEYYNNFESIDSDIWLGYLKDTLQTLESDEVYAGYSVREKFLSFYYTLIEILKKDRSFVVYSYKSLPQPVARHVGVLHAFKNGFQNYATEIVLEGRESKEVVIRPVISDRYVDGLWLQCLYILDFWIKDTSRGFESSDTAIEKMVNTSFDLMGKSVVDTVLDLAKFVYQNRRP
ncbi:TetR family transcriptional regulator C-terminal domain-containing protein [Arundinibacter roseus]|uniref:TetR/AcrR family transcriptional regulator n=1 Tax=Arundinibacter roseus TaxID=2070510 RepID=A0A4R4KG11_9BACT|nr:TetR family transcriptional regulator C-terminal domain-containing protein [Arundinibacter roseus]TDB66974.1 TetR/AcrR family transcriptional regulator [Arundinibacter roseus]